MLEWVGGYMRPGEEVHVWVIVFAFAHVELDASAMWVFEADPEF